MSLVHGMRAAAGRATKVYTSFSPSFSLKASPKCRPRPSSALGARMAGTQARCSDHIPGTSGTRKATRSCQEHLPVIHFMYGLNEKLRHLLSSFLILSFSSCQSYRCYKCIMLRCKQEGIPRNQLHFSGCFPSKRKRIISGTHNG